MYADAIVVVMLYKHLKLDRIGLCVCVFKQIFFDFVYFFPNLFLLFQYFFSPDTPSLLNAIVDINFCVTGTRTLISTR